MSEFQLLSDDLQSVTFTTQGQDILSCYYWGRQCISISDNTLVYFFIIGTDNMFLPEQPSSAITINMCKENCVDNVSVIICMKNEIKIFFSKYILYILWFISIIYVIVDILSKLFYLFIFMVTPKLWLLWPKHIVCVCVCVYIHTHNTEIKKCTVNDRYLTLSTRPTLLSVILLAFICSSKQILRQIPVTNIVVIRCS